ADPNTIVNIDPNAPIDMAHSDMTGAPMDSNATVQDVYDAMTEEQKAVLHFMVGEALASNDSSANDSSAQHGNHYKEGNDMNHNIFESNNEVKSEATLSHEDMKGIIADATRNGSLRDAAESYALAHGIDSVDQLFPEAANIYDTPQFLTRRVEWVSALLGGVNKTPINRIKTLNANLTYDEARAKGYVKGALKQDEFFNVTKRVTTPTTIYKKQQLDRDDIVDITDFDVVTWLKGEMRLMLDEELARAILIGDGRGVSDVDKINEQNIRPIVGEHELYATTVTINTADGGSSAQEIIDAVIANRWQYKGTGTPVMFASETTISKFLLLKDTLGRQIYSSLAEVAAVLRVSSIIPVEAMESIASGSTAFGTLAIIVNPVDYAVGATAGGQVSMFDFFDIDYNKQKYLIETRASGALTRLKSAVIVKDVTNSSAVAVVPNAPTFVKGTGVVTIVATTGVVYKNDATGASLTTGAQTALANVGDSISITAYPSTANYFIANDAQAVWTFTRRAATS
ncbi:MAG: phage major capsid protein, partial [Actinomycetes bacterium]